MGQRGSIFTHNYLHIYWLLLSNHGVGSSCCCRNYSTEPASYGFRIVLPSRGITIMTTMMMPLFVVVVTLMSPFVQNKIKCHVMMMPCHLWRSIGSIVMTIHGSDSGWVVGITTTLMATWPLERSSTLPPSKYQYRHFQYPRPTFSTQVTHPTCPTRGPITTRLRTSYEWTGRIIVRTTITIGPHFQQSNKILRITYWYVNRATVSTKFFDMSFVIVEQSGSEITAKLISLSTIESILVLSSWFVKVTPYGSEKRTITGRFSEYTDLS